MEIVFMLLCYNELRIFNTSYQIQIDYDSTEIN